MDQFEIDCSGLKDRLEFAGYMLDIDAVGFRQSDRALLFSVDGVLMYPSDALDIAAGRATVSQILRRNAKAIFPLSPHRP